jgi:AraC-like DNA-binding protein
MRVELALDDGALGEVARHRALDRPLIDPSLHCHDELECNLVLRGHARYLLQGRRYDCCAGALIWLFPDQEHMLYEQSEDFEMWVVVFVPTLLQRLAEALPATSRTRDPGGHFVRLVPPRTRIQLDQLCRQVAAEGPTPGRNAGLAWLLVRAWRAFLQAAEQVPLETVHPAIAQVVLWLQAGDDRGAAELARAAGVSSPWLSRSFKRALGMPLTQFRNRQRLQRVVDLLAGPRPPSITEAAFAAGWGSYAQFHKSFVAFTGCSPRDWLRRYG